MLNKNLSDLKNNISGRIQGKIGVLVNPTDFINNTVNEVHSMVDLRSMIRSARILPSSVDGISKYQIPIDVKGDRVIDLPTQVQRQFSEFDLVTPEQFKIMQRDGDFAIEYIDEHPVLLFKNTADVSLSVTSFPSDDVWSTKIKSITSLIEFFDTDKIKDNSLLGDLGFIQDIGQTITITGTASNNGSFTIIAIIDDNTIQVSTSITDEVAPDTTITGGDDLKFKGFNFTNYFKGNSSLQIEDTNRQLELDISKVSDDDGFDISPFIKLESSLHLRTKIDNSSNISNITVRLGNDADNYYSVSGLFNSLNSGFIKDGWNLFAFDFFRKTNYNTTISETGTPTPDGIKYISVIFSKSDESIEHKILLDEIILQKGTLYEMKYYSKYPWKDADTGERKLLATKETDILVCDADEYQIFRKHISFEMAIEADLPDGKIDRLEKWRNDDILEYSIKNPSVAKILINTYKQF